MYLTIRTPNVRQVSGNTPLSTRGHLAIFPRANYTYSYLFHVMDVAFGVGR